MSDPVDIITPTTVERVTTASGSYIDPPCPDYGDHRDRLAWKLGVVCENTGIALELHDYGSFINLAGPGFCTQIGGGDVWLALSFFDLGAAMARKADA